MRDLIEKASLGTPGRHKVYILDEVHMLSKAAEAALLKTLEEPPPHVVFVLATTDPQKMSATIISRTQHLQFHLLPADTLAEHVRWVAADAGLDVSEAALDQVLMRGGGSARDTLSALELVASTGDDGITNLPLDEFVEAMVDRDAGRALTMVAHAVSLGTDSRRVTEELIGYLRNGFLSLMAPELVQLPSHRLDALAEQAQRLGAAGLVRGIEVLGAVLTEMRHAPDPRVLLDVATVQLTSEAVAADVPALMVRLDRLERQLAEGGAPPAAAPAQVPVDPSTGRAALGGRVRRSSAPVGSSDSSAPAPPESAPQSAPAAAPVAASSPVAAVTADDWENSLRPSLRGMPRAIYAPATFVRCVDGVLTLSVPNAVHLAKCEEHRAAVEQMLSTHAGVPFTVALVDGGSGGGGGSGAERAPSSAERDDTPVDPIGDDDTPDSVGVGELPDDDDVDLDDLVDAPPESVKTPIDRLAEAFPGSELIEEAG
jgi:DNA polymerase-3 subunit gamma/tau